MAYASTCIHCGRKLHNAVFCSTCQLSLCSWHCYMEHLAEHAAAAALSPRGDHAPPAAGFTLNLGEPAKKQ